MAYRYLFGPVSSRRLGLSLGVDLLPFKTCSLDCVYCELGGTTTLTMERREWVPTDEVIAELDKYLAQDPPLDYITFAGSGEPLLHSGIGTIIRWIREHHPRYAIAVLTNGTLFHEPGVIEAVAPADLVVPSVDAISEEVFEAVNRPASGLTSALAMEGMRAFAERYPGKVWLELFVVPGINDSTEEIAALREFIRELHPARTQLNSLDRPGTEAWVATAGREFLEGIAGDFPGGEVICRGRSTPLGVRPNEVLEAVTASLKRRPQTLEDLKETLKLHHLELEKALSALETANLVRREHTSGDIFYVWHPSATGK